ncbi:hypothetical protein E3N88_25135 [Mikania micrantha]|uniref:Uncharacterized protein n=1 Tax=Mikania micrantha TaxID=192012 RepID=A0A5N6N4C7_9ASTR|nr:hypothetical protein E3N88_25135 [Mikania micrantha]
MGSSDSKTVNPQIVIAGHRRSRSGASEIDDQICSGTQSGHKRTCSLSGQNQTQQRACHLKNLTPLDGTISVVGMSNVIHMGEAIYQAMNDINEQSLSLLPQPSSLPAPCQVVETFSVKRYINLQKHFNQEEPQMEMKFGYFLATMNSIKAV